MDYVGLGKMPFGVQKRFGTFIIIKIKERQHSLFFYYNTMNGTNLFFWIAFISLSLIFQLSIEPEQFFDTTNKFLESYIKDGKKANPDFDTLTELTAITLGDQPQPSSLSQDVYEENEILIDINLQIQQKYISESLLYNTNNLSHIKVRNFSQHFLKDLLKENGIQLSSKDSLQCKQSQYLELEEQVRIQIRTQCLYKTLLKKHAPILLNFSTIQIPSEVRQYLIPIEIKLKDQNGQIAYQDYFQWDILSQNNKYLSIQGSFDQFCQQLMIDAELDPKLYSQLCYKIRSQINAQLEWKFMLLVKTFKQIHKDRESPKLNTQTIMIIKKNLSYTMDVLLPADNKSYQPSQSIYFSNSDLFSLLSRNADILPQEFQEILMCKQGKDRQQQKQTGSSNLGSMPNLSNKMKRETVHEILKKNNVDLQSNSYLSGSSGSMMVQYQNAWKKLTNEKISSN